MIQNPKIPAQFAKYSKGRGVQIIEQFVPGVPNDSTEQGSDPFGNLVVPGLLLDDELIAVQDVTDEADLTVLPDTEGRPAFTTFFSSNKLFRLTTVRNVLAESSGVWFRIRPADFELDGSGSKPSSVTVLPPLAFEIEAGVAPTDRIITVFAHTSFGFTIDLRAFELVTLINNNPLARQYVVASLPTGTGITAVTATDGLNLIGVDATTASTAAQAGILRRFSRITPQDDLPGPRLRVAEDTDGHTVRVVLARVK